MTDFDPTKIDIQFNPLLKRMNGVTAHGNIPFDVPFISPITDTLWQGGCTNGLRLPPEVKHLVSLYPWENYEQNPSGKLQSMLAFTMYDSNDKVNENQVMAIGQWVHDCMKDGVTLVHCQAGLNRSALIAATALWLDDHESMTSYEIIQLLRKRRSPAVLCNETFEQFILDLDRYD